MSFDIGAYSKDGLIEGRGLNRGFMVCIGSLKSLIQKTSWRNQSVGSVGLLRRVLHPTFADLQVTKINFAKIDISRQYFTGKHNKIH